MSEMSNIAGTAPAIVKSLIEGNIRYVKKHSAEYHALKDQQTPKITLLTCGDSRIPQNLFDVDSPNELFIIRNIGNQFRNSEGSIKYPLLHLHTPVMIVMGHTGCGAIKAALSDYRGEDDTIQREVIGLVNSIRLANQVKNAHCLEDESMRHAIYAQVNVDHQVSKIVTEYNIKSLIEKGSLSIIGMMFDIHGIYGEEEANVYITNINGLTDASKIMVHPLLSALGKDIISSKVLRL
jgi:carbonic anhydrase